MKIRAIGVSATILLLGLSLAPRAAFAEVCGNQILSTTGSYFVAYESVEYSAEGYLTISFRNASTTAKTIHIGTSFYDDECVSSRLNISWLGYTDYPTFTIPAGVTNWSVRFTAIDHFEVWDDDNNSVLMSADTVTLPIYTSVSIAASFSIFNNNDTLFSRRHKIKIDGVPPIVENKLDASTSPCPAMTGVGTFFDPSYERAEYVDGLLRVHLRRGHEAIGNFYANVFPYAPPASCSATISATLITGPLTVPTTELKPYFRYFSLRMTSPTHWVFWDDENDVPYVCQHCEGDIPAGTSHVFLYAQHASRDSEIRTTMYPPVQQGCIVNCNSNVMFLPGFQASRLYEPTPFGQSGENQLWEPDSVQADVVRLYLDQNGDSINPVYTKAEGAIDHAGPPLIGLDIYKTFLQQLSGFVDSDMIAEYRVFPYDWRMSVEDIVENGTIYNDGVHFPEAEIEALAESSRTGKVTIIAHSNGGLLAKALMRKLEAEGKEDLVDKIIFVGSPQLGTPKTIASMLHGDFQAIPGGFGLIASKPNARGLAEYMQAGFGLLPSAEYFNRVADPVIDVSKAPILKAGGALIDPLVDSAGELSNFLEGAGGRQKPQFFDTETPNVLSPTLLGLASTTHDNLDNWVPPSGVEVVQIVGWGRDTPKGITYVEETRVFCAGLSCANATTTKHRVEVTEDGDETVVAVSAAAMNSLPIYYVNIRKYNIDKGLNAKHASMTEVQSVQQLLSQFIIATSTPQPLPSYVTREMPPSSSADKSLRLHVLSPVTLDAYDDFGNHTGLAPNPIPGSDLLYKEEQIPNSYYEEFGEGKYVGLPNGNYYIVMKGLDAGTFTFEVELVEGNVVQKKISYRDIPVTASTTATIEINSDNIDTSQLSLDFSSDGIIDAELGTDTISSDPVAYIDLLLMTVENMNLAKSTENQLFTKLKKIQKILKKGSDPDGDVEDGGEHEHEDDSQVSSASQVLKEIDKLIALIQKGVAKPKNNKHDETIYTQDAEVLLNMTSHLKSLIQ